MEGVAGVCSGGRGRGQRQGPGEESTGRDQSGSGRQNPPSPHPCPEHSACHPWACQVDGGGEGQDPGWDELCLSLQGLACGRLMLEVGAPLPLFSCPATK